MKTSIYTETQGDFQLVAAFIGNAKRKKRKGFNSPLIGPYPGPWSRGFVLTRTWCSSHHWSSSTTCKKAPVFYDDNPLKCSPFPNTHQQEAVILIIHRYFGLLSIVPYMKFCVLSGIMIGLFSWIGQGFSP